MSGTLLGGDETGAVVLDIGSHLVKAGIAGEDTPKVVFPTTAGVEEQAYEDNGELKTRRVFSLGSNRIAFPKEGRELINPVRNGLIDHWDMAEAIVSHCYNGLQCNSKESPLMVVEPAWNTAVQRERMAELAFETFDVPAFYLVKSPVVSSFANGRGTSLVVDSGAEFTTVVPVYDGLVLTQGLRRSRLAGNFITEQFEHILANKYQVDVVPPCMIGSKAAVGEEAEASWTKKANFPDVTDSYLAHMRRDVIRDFQHTICRTSDQTFDERLLRGIPTTPYEFPNGYNRSWGIERYNVTEALFNPDEFSVVPANDAPSDPPKEDMEKTAEKKMPAERPKTFMDLAPALFSRQAPAAEVSLETHSIGVQHLISEAITNCDIDVQPTLWSNVVVCGGNTLHTGFIERLSYELRSIVPPGTRYKISTGPSNSERMFSAWIGGSIYGSLGAFQQLWVSKQEYEEHGATIVSTRCP